MNSFIQGYFIEDTYVRQLANSLLTLRKEMLDMSFDKANNLILRVEDLGKGLFSISSKTVLDHLLQDMKYLLKLLVSVTIRYQDGAKVNKEAINTLYGLFIPLGYEQLEVYNPMDFIYL